jgi:hypothetical protein
MWPKDDSQSRTPSHRVLWLVLGLLNIGCHECEPFTMRCSGNMVQLCEPLPCAERGDGWGGCRAYWDTLADCEASGQVCTEGSPREALCATLLVHW